MGQPDLFRLLAQPQTASFGSALKFDTLKFVRSRDLPLRLPKPGERGEPFIDWLRRGRDKRLVERMTAFIQEWNHLRDDLCQVDSARQDPTVEEFADRWQVPVPTAYRMQAEFRSIFPSEATPARLIDLLTDGLPAGSGPYVWLLAVQVVER